MKIEGTFKDGKYFRGNGRWAKVVALKTGNSLAFGTQGQVQAFATRTLPSGWAGRSVAVDQAKVYIETGKN